MDARLERKLRLLASIIVFGIIAGIVFNVAQGRTTPRSIVAGLSYGL
jgi:hypothetical protein